MTPEQEEKILLDFLKTRRSSYQPSAQFDARIMEEVRTAARGRRASHSPHSLFRAWLARLNPNPAAFFLRPMVATPALLALVLGTGLLIRDPGTAGLGSFPWDREGSTRIKGGNFAVSFLKRTAASGLEPVKAGQILHAGDALQPLVWQDDSAFVGLFSMDERGKVQCLTCGTVEGRLPASQGRPFPFGLELDSSIGEELFLALRSADPLDIPSLEARLKDAWSATGGNLRAMEKDIGAWGGPALSVRSLVIRKELKP